MNDQKQKNKNFHTEFSFSFGGLADTVQNALGSMGEAPETAFFEEPRGDETLAKVVIDAGVGKLHIHAGEDSAVLTKVETRHIGTMHFSAETKGETKTVKIENQTLKRGLRGLIGGIGQRDLYVDVALSPGLPIDLRVDNGMGEALLDLRGLTLDNFKLDAGVGPSTVYLPEGDYKAAFEGGVGPTTIHLPAVTGNKVRIDNGVGPVTVHVPDFADLTLDIEGGVGPFTLNLPEGTPLMVEYESGIGPFHKPAGLVQKQKNVWQTEGYDLADKSVYVKLEGGVGPSRIAFTEAAKAKPKNEE